jgi:hypothetical protein
LLQAPNASTQHTCTSSRRAPSPATGARSQPVQNCRKARFSSMGSASKTALKMCLAAAAALITNFSHKCLGHHSWNLHLIFVNRDVTATEVKRMLRPSASCKHTKHQVSMLFQAVYCCFHIRIPLNTSVRASQLT